MKQARKQTNPDGTSIETFPDGRIVQTTVDGTKLEVFPGGHRVQTNVDGTTIHTAVDGSRIQRNPDGSSLEVRLDGSRLQTVSTLIHKSIVSHGARTSMESPYKCLKMEVVFNVIRTVAG